MLLGYVDEGECPLNSDVLAKSESRKKQPAANTSRLERLKPVSRYPHRHMLHHVRDLARDGSVVNEPVSSGWNFRLCEDECLSRDTNDAFVWPASGARRKNAASVGGDVDPDDGEIAAIEFEDVGAAGGAG